MLSEEDTFSLENDPEHILEFGQQVSASISGALVYMRMKFKHGSIAGDKIDSGGWSQFLQEQTKPPTVTGTACIISSMVAAGESKNSEIITLGKRLIIDHVRDDGGWSKPSLDRYFSLTLITCLALRALLDANQPSSSAPIQRGTEWLLDAQNSDGGWGNLSRDNMSDITSTAYAMRVLTRTVNIHPSIEIAMNRGHKWIIDAQNPDHSWGRRPGETGTLPHTSHAVEALLACGVNPSSMLPVREWLTANIGNSSQFLEHYIVEVPDGTTERLTWTHLSDERALIALLKLGAGITAPEVDKTVRRILARQVDGTYWSIDTVPFSAPSWAIVEAMLSLRLYLNCLERQGYIIVLSRTVSDLKRVVREQSERILGLESQIAESSIKARLARLARFLLQPVRMLIVFTFALVTIFVFLGGQLNLPAFADTIAGVVGILGLSLTIYQIIEMLRNRRARG